MKTNDYEHIILNETEDIKQEFYIKSSKGKKSNKELLLLTNKRIYFYGKDHGLFMRSTVSRFLNLKAIFAGSRSKGRYPILLFFAIVLLMMFSGTILLSQLGYIDLSLLAIKAYVPFIGIGVGFILLFAYIFVKEQIIILEYPGDNLVIHCNHMKERDINKMFRHISRAIDQS